MKETYDAVLVHGYTDEAGFSSDFGDRNEMQATAVEQLYRAGYAKRIVVAGGSYWGDDKPTFAQAMGERLTDHGVDPQAIILRPEATTTDAEIVTFLGEARTQEWERLASLSTRSHTPRITINYLRKRRGDVDQIKAEKVLYNVRVNDEYPHREFLARFRVTENKFIVREAIAITLELYGLKKLLQSFSDSNLGKQIKAKLDK